MVQMGRRRDVADAAFLAPLVARAREALGEAGYADAQAVGRALSYDDAVDAMQQWLRQSTKQTDTFCRDIVREIRKRRFLKKGV